MRSLRPVLITVCFLLTLSSAYAGKESCEMRFIPGCDKLNCCTEMGGISYCDSSAGRYVCNNGYFSSCYCTRHAVMDIQKIQGCCLWQGGVSELNSVGQVVCNNGGISEVCSLEAPPQNVSSW